MPRLYEQYDREKVRDMFAPDAPYTAGAGFWGMRGIIPLRGRPGDFVLFVSLGQITGDHTFDEGISDQGILRWQSEPRQTLRSVRVLELIGHDDANNIHLFLRTDNLAGGVAKPYTYLGLLQYHSHDAQREQPVHISWDLQSWPIPEEIRRSMSLMLDREMVETPLKSTATLPAGLMQIDTPQGRRPGETSRQFRGRKNRRPSESQLREIGLKGELLVLEYEKARLLAAGKKRLAAEVEHVSVTQGDGVGYDIKSFGENDAERQIEVKTTIAGPGTSFEVSANEVEFSELNPKTFAIYRLVNFDKEVNRAEFYIVHGSLKASHTLAPTSYRAILNPPTTPPVSCNKKD